MCPGQLCPVRALKCYAEVTNRGWCLCGLGNTIRGICWERSIDRLVYWVKDVMPLMNSNPKQYQYQHQYQHVSDSHPQYRKQYQHLIWVILCLNMKLLNSHYFWLLCYYLPRGAFRTCYKSLQWLWSCSDLLPKSVPGVPIMSGQSRQIDARTCSNALQSCCLLHNMPLGVLHDWAIPRPNITLQAPDSFTNVMQRGDQK